MIFWGMHLARVAACPFLAAMLLLTCSCSCDEAVSVGATGDSAGAEAGAKDGSGNDQAELFDGFAGGEGSKDLFVSDASLPLPLPFCQRTCTKSADCCASPPCDKGRDAVSCQAGYCTQVGCKTDADCLIAGAQAGTCKQIKDVSYGTSYGLCGDWCAKDSDCSKPDKCVARLLASGDDLCGTPCTKDSQCLPALVCIDGKFCGKKEQRLCKSDSQCPSYAGLLRCYLKLGRCYCDGDVNCQTALGQRKGGTWVCK